MALGRLVLLPPEDEVVETEHIEGGQTGHGRHPDIVEGVVQCAGGQNLVFREETGKRDDTGDGETPDKESRVSHRHAFAQTAHGGVVVAADGMNQCAGAKEEQSLEHRMGEQVEHRSHVAHGIMKLRTGHAERNHHERNLRDG